MPKEVDRTLTGLARRVEVFLDLVIFNELRKIAMTDDTTVSKILSQIVIEHFRERGVPRRAPESQRHSPRPPQAAQQPQNQPAGQQPTQAGQPTDPAAGLRRRRRRRRGGRGPKSEGGGGGVGGAGESGG